MASLEQLSIEEIEAKRKCDNAAYTLSQAFEIGDIDLERATRVYWNAFRKYADVLLKDGKPIKSLQ